MDSVQSCYAEVNGAKLYYEMTGEGEPIVLVHGFTLNLKMWGDQFKEFSQHYKVIRYDVRGFGKSSTPIEGKPYSHYDDLKALLDHLGIREAHFIGLSMGGSIAIGFTLEYPEYVSSLITVDSSLDGFNYSRDFLKWYLSLFMNAKEAGVEATLEAFMNGPLFESTMRNPLAADKLRQIVRSYSGWSFLHDDPEIEPVPSPHTRLHEINCPTLVVVGEHDLPDFHNIADKINEEVPNSKKLVIPGVGHMSNLEDSKSFNKEILSFLESLKRTYT